MVARIFFRAWRQKDGTFSARCPGKEMEVFGAKDKKDCILKCMAVARMNAIHRVDVVVDFQQEQLQ